MWWHWTWTELKGLLCTVKSAQQSATIGQHEERAWEWSKHECNHLLMYVNWVKPWVPIMQLFHLTMSKKKVTESNVTKITTHRIFLHWRLKVPHKSIHFYVKAATVRALELELCYIQGRFNIKFLSQSTCWKKPKQWHQLNQYESIVWRKYEIHNRMYLYMFVCSAENISQKVPVF